MNLTDLGLTPDELRDLVIERAAEKIADEAAGREYVGDSVTRIIQQRIDTEVKARLVDRIEALLAETLERLLNDAIRPVDIWGDPVGAPTTIKAELGARAKDYWLTKVDNGGKPMDRNSYGFQTAKTRAEWMLGRVVSEQFADEVKQNAVNILAVFKEKIRADGHAALDKHLDEIVRVKSR